MAIEAGWTPGDTGEPDEPAWTVPGATPDPDTAQVSTGSLALLAEIGAAVEEQRRAGARLYRAITAIHHSDVLAETGYRRLNRLLEDHARLDPKTVATLERHAAALHEDLTPTGARVPAELPATAAAVDDALIDRHHVEIIRTTMRRLRAVPELPEPVLDATEQQLAGLAATHSPRQLTAAATAVADRLDPDGAAPHDDDPTGNELRYTTRRNGHLNATLLLRDPAAAALFDEAVRAATPTPVSATLTDPDTGPVDTQGPRLGMDPHHEAHDSAPARRASGLLDLIAASHHTGLNHPEPTADEPPAPQAAAEAAEDPAAEAAEDPAVEDPAPLFDTDPAEPPPAEPPPAEPPPAEPAPDPSPSPRPWTPPAPETTTTPGRERLTLTVTADYQALRTQLTDTSPTLTLLGDSTWIRPDTARRLACDADLIPMILGTHSEILDVGRRTRTIPTATARAVTTRDRHCAFPGCRRRTSTTEIHHIHHWADHGPTEPDNLVCLCRYHHMLIHHSDWDIHMINHMPWFRPPPWLDPTRTPRHNRPWQNPSACPPTA